MGFEPRSAGCLQPLDRRPRSGLSVSLEFLNLGYLAYLVFCEFCREAFPDVRDEAVSQMVTASTWLWFARTKS
jgi:hypothetical protein